MEFKVLKLNDKSQAIELKVAESKMPANALEVITRVAKQNLKQGTKAVKDRSEVRGRAAKPFRQKGTGNARQGSRKGPHMRGGGIAHGTTMDTRSLGLNKKFKNLVLKNILLSYANDDKLSFIDLKGDAKDLRKLLKDSPKTLLIHSLENKDTVRSVRNLPKVRTLVSSSMSPLLMTDFNQIIIDLSEKERIEKILG